MSCFTYSPAVSHFFDKDFETRPSDRVRFQLLDRKSGVVLTEIITNGNGEGSWVYDGRRYEYRQVRGTCQYSIPGTPQGIRKALRTQLAEELTLKLEQGQELTDAEKKAAIELKMAVSRFIISCSEFSFKYMSERDAIEFAERESYIRESSVSAEFTDKEQALDAFSHCCCQLSNRGGRTTATLYWLHRVLVIDGREFDGDRKFAQWR